METGTVLVVLVLLAIGAVVFLIINGGQPAVAPSGVSGAGTPPISTGNPITDWEANVFNPSSTVSPNFAGFGSVKPIEWSCRGGDLTISITNNAEEEISGVGIEGGTCVDTEVLAGGKTRCTIENAEGCAGVAGGERFETDIAINYETEPGSLRTSSGTVWGPAE